MSKAKVYNAASIDALDGFDNEPWRFDVEYGALYDSDGRMVGDKIVGTEDGLTFFLPDGYKWEDLWAAHTHAGEYGGTFSVFNFDSNTGSVRGDVHHLTDAGMIGYVASCNEGTYTLARTPRSNREGFFQAARRAEEDAEDSALEIIADRWAAQGKVVNSYQAYLDNIEERRIEKAKAMHEWFKANSSKYGYNYSFAPRSGV